jgi:hypothetical protein
MFFARKLAQLLQAKRERQQAKLDGRLFVKGSPRRSRKIVTAPIAAKGTPASFPRQLELASKWLAANQSEAVQIRELRKLER